MEIEVNKKQNRKVTIFAIILSVISIGLLIFGFSIVSSDKVVLLQSLSNLSKKLDNNLNNSSSLLNKIANSNDIGIRSNIKLSADSANLSIGLDYLENKVDKKSQLLFDAKINEQDLLGLDLALDNDKAYFFVDNITPRYYYTALEYTSFISSLSGDDYDKILSLLKDSITDNVSDDNIKKEKVTISYNGKDKKVNKLTYEITNKMLKETINNFLNAIKKDKKLLQNLSSYMDMTTEELSNSFDEFLDSLNIEEEKVIFNYCVYYYGFNKIVQYSLEEKKANVSIDYKVENKETITLSEGDVTILSLEITKNKNKYDYSGFILTDEELEEKLKFSGSVQNDTVTIIIDKDGALVKLVITSTEEEKESSFYSKMHMVLSTIMNGQETEVGTLDIDSEYYFNKKVNINITDSMDISQITEEDMSIMQNNIMNHPIYQLIATITGGTEISL